MSKNTKPVSEKEARKIIDPVAVEAQLAVVPPPVNETEAPKELTPEQKETQARLEEFLRLARTFRRYRRDLKATRWEIEKYSELRTDDSRQENAEYYKKMAEQKELLMRKLVGQFSIFQTHFSSKLAAFIEKPLTSELDKFVLLDAIQTFIREE